MDWGEFRAGARRILPVVFSVSPFGLLFGALAVKNGLTVGEATLMSAAIYGGASQLVGIDLFSHKIAPWIVVLSIFAVNFRHVLYSAAIARHVDHLPLGQRLANFFLLTDPHYAETERVGGLAGNPISFSWLMGLGLTLYIPWVALSLVGALLGGLIGEPQTLGLDILLPIYFLGLVMGFRSRKNWLPVVLASAAGSILAMKFVGSPWHVSIGALFGVAAAMVMPVKSNAVDDEQGASQ